MNIIGIDLGTTNSACGIFRHEKVDLIPNRYGEYLTPSVVGIDDQGELLVGQLAKQRLVSHPTRSTAAFKRYMGTEHSIKIGKQSYNPTELSAMVLRSIKEDAEKFIGEPVEEAVISVPAYFNDIQRKATKAAGELAGFKVERLINEPTAAAMAYGLHEKPEGNHFMVVDLGGGTFDVSIMEYFEGVLEVHASAGDNFLGGEDFLENLLKFYLEKVNRKKEKLSYLELSKTYAALEKIKRQLSSEQTITIPPILKPKDGPVEISREDFFAINQSLLHKIQIPIERALRDANLKPHELGEVVLVGGATRMQIFRRLIARMFRRMPAANLDPDLVVATGAAIQAGLKGQHKALEDVVLTDVCPYSLGTDIINHNDPNQEQGGVFSPIIERNTVVPASKIKRYCTAADNQTEIELSIYQGESRLVKNNILLGKIEAKVPKGTKGQETVDVRFSYDMNGLLEVDVTVTSTGVRYNTLIDNSSQKLTEKQIQESRKKLASLKFHPRDDEVNRSLILRAEQIYESSLGDVRELISESLKSFESSLETQNPREIKQAQKEFSKMLSRFEKDSLFE